jgi:hypothetical protein
MRLQRKRHLLWGAIPFGDPENRPNNIMQMLPLVGINPEQCVFVSPPGNSAPITAVLTSQATIYANYELQYIDLLPDGVEVPEPTVGFGLQLTASTFAAVAAGANALMTHRTAQAGLWDDQDQQSAKYAYDATQWTFQTYFQKYFFEKRRYPVIGQYTADFDSGVFPEIPSIDPYDGIMSPDATYAAAFTVPVTPAMTTSLRLPSGVTAVNPYIRIYAFGLVRVPY